MSERTPLTRNPGFAGETGDFGALDEADVRGTAYYGDRPVDGGSGGGVNAYPYQLPVRHPEAPLFEGPYRERFDKILARYPDRQGALLPVLNLAQEVRGHVGPEAMARVADILDLSHAYVRGVATFYTMYNKRPVGRFLIQVCTNIACNLCGGDEVLEAFLEHTGVEAGETTADGLFTSMEAECLGACGFPTAVQINSRYFENVTPEDVPVVLERLRAEASALGDAADETPPLPESLRAVGTLMGTPGRSPEAVPQTPQPEPERAEGSVSPEQRRGVAEQKRQHMERGSPAVPPTPGGASSAGPAGPEASPNERPHRSENESERS